MNAGYSMLIIPTDTDPALEDPVAQAAADLLEGISMEPVPHHLLVLAQQLQRALEQKAGGVKFPEAKRAEPSDCEPPAL